MPCFPTHHESEEQKKIRERHDKRKGSQKKYFDKRRKAANKDIQIGDKVLVKQTKSTTKPPFNPTPFKVISVQGNRVTATDGNKNVTRDKNQLKKLHTRPNSLKPSWERGVRFNLGPQTKASGSSTEEFADDDHQNTTSDDVIPANNQETPENVSGDIEESGNDSGRNTSPVRITEDMAKHMENLFAQA